MFFKKQSRADVSANAPPHVRAPAHVCCHLLTRGAFRFCAQLKKAHPALTTKELTLQLRLRWEGLSEKEKKPFEKKHSHAKADFAEALRQYKLRHPDVFIDSEDEDDSDSDGASAAVAPGVPVKPKSAYMMFAASARPDVSRRMDCATQRPPCLSTRDPQIINRYPGIKPTAIMIEIGRRWRNVDDLERKMWNDRHQKAMAEYTTAIRRYFEGRF
jgi:hypothetical protein